MPSMVDLVERYYQPVVTHSGQWSFWHCPRHPDPRPSFAVREGNDYAYCFQCRQSWGPVRFLCEVCGLSKPVALGIAGADRFPDVPLSRRPVKARLKLPPLPPSLEWQAKVRALVDVAAGNDMPQQATLELASRAISPEVWRRYRVGWMHDWVSIELEGEEKPAWMAKGHVIPYYVQGVLWSVNVRTGGKPKYLQVRGGTRCPLGLGQLQGRDTLVVVEGDLDVLTAATAVSDVADVIGLGGARHTLADWLHWTAVYQRVIQCLDGDEVGQDAAAQIRERYPHWENRKPPKWADDLGKMAQKSVPIRPFLLEGVLL